MAKYKIIPSSRTIVQSPISIGHKAEKGVEAIEFDVTAWVETYGSGTLTVIMRRWGDAIPYPIALEIDENNKATWVLSDIDTAKAGMAYAQLSYIVGDEVVKKSDIYTFRVMDSLTGEGEPPEAYESWLEHLTHLAAEAMAEVLDIEGIVTDKTLTVDGGIADAKATGDALAEKVDAADYSELRDRVGRNTIALAEKADRSTTYTKTEVDQMIEDVEVETDTTLAISGAAADAAETGRQIGLIKADLGAVTDLVGGSETLTPSHTLINGYTIQASTSSITIIEASTQSVTDYIEVQPGDKVYAKGGSLALGTAAFFNASKVGITGGYNFVPGQNEYVNKTAPESAAYIVFSGITSRMASLDFYILRETEGEIPADIAQIQTDIATQTARIDSIIAQPTAAASAGKTLFYAEALANYFYVSETIPSVFQTVNGVNKYLAVSGSEGGTTLTPLSGGTAELSDFGTAFFGAVVEYDDGTVLPYTATVQNGSVTVYPALSDDITSGKLGVIRGGSVNSIHLSELGYKGYAQAIYKQNPRYCQKDKYLARYCAWNGDTQPLTKINNSYIGALNAGIGGYVSRNYTGTYLAVYGTSGSSATPKGGKMTQALGQKKGYVELLIGADYGNNVWDASAADAFVIELWLDGVLAQSYTKTMARVEQICLPFDGADSGELRMYSTSSGAKHLRVSEISWWVNDSYPDKLIPTGSVVGQFFDSWGVFHNSASAAEFKRLISKDMGVTVRYENHSKGDQTSAWGRAWFYENVQKYGVKIMLTDFLINDANSATISGWTPTVEGPDGTEYNNIISTAAMYAANMSDLFKMAIVNDITPIMCGVCLHQGQSYYLSLISAWAEQVAVS